MLQQKLSAAEDERINLINENDNQNQEINDLRDELGKYRANDNLFFEEQKQNENKFNNLAQAFHIKEREFSDDIEKLRKINQKLQIENENLKNKYEKKVNLLTLQNNESTLRVRKLINTCISLKNYALTIERNLNMSNINNNSMLLGQGSQFMANYQKNKDLLAGMNNIINQIDSKILKDDFLNQTY